MSQIQTEKILVTNQEFISDLNYKFELNLNRDWQNYGNQYKQKIEIVQDNRLFITQIYVDDKLVYDLAQDQQKQLDQCVEFNKQELDQLPKRIELGYTKEDMSKWDLYSCKSCHSFKENRTHDFEYITCKNCELLESMVYDFEQLENEDMETRLDILNREYTENIRKVEPKKNKYCQVKEVKELVSINHDTDKRIYKKVKNYVFKCGETRPLDYNTLDIVTSNHIETQKCNVCKILNGSKRKSGLKQDELSKLFSLGYNGYETRNMRITDNTLMHYRTIEAIRTIDNEIISNSQCWSSGFAYCPHVYTKNPQLPLSAIDSINGIDPHYIKILDHKDSNILFTVRKEIKHYKPSDEYNVQEVIKRTYEKCYYLTGRDDGQTFLVELYDKPKTIKQAFKTMLPIDAINRKNVLRQGDLFFIPTKEDFKEYDKQHYEPSISDLTDYENKLISYQATLELSLVNKYPLSRYNIDFNITDLILKQDEYKKTFNEKSVNRILELTNMLLKKHKGNLKRNQIFDTNHESQYMKQENNQVFVNGHIIHTNRQHQKLTLDKWYQVVKNRVKESFTVRFDHSGGYGRD